MEASKAPEGPPGPEGDPGQSPGPVASQASGPAMMVFGPLLAVSALEYLFLGDEILRLIASVFA